MYSCVRGGYSKWKPADSDRGFWKIFLDSSSFSLSLSYVNMTYCQVIHLFLCHNLMSQGSVCHCILYLMVRLIDLLIDTIAQLFLHFYNLFYYYKLFFWPLWFLFLKTSKPITQYGMCYLFHVLPVINMDLILVNLFQIICTMNSLENILVANYYVLHFKCTVTLCGSFSFFLSLEWCINSFHYISDLKPICLNGSAENQTVGCSNMNCTGTFCPILRSFLHWSTKKEIKL